MDSQFNFSLNAEKPLSKVCVSKGLNTFKALCNFVKQLPYGRTKNRSDYTSILIENKGTCSTKHAFLKQVAIENEQPKITLHIAIYKMNGTNTKGVETVLENYNLQYIPEAHTYLKINNIIVDITRTTRSKNSFKNTLLDEKEILPQDIGDYKINYHQDYLKQWLINKNTSFSFKEIWEIREACILALSQNN